MAQVKKLSGGETIPKKYGHLIIDGIDLGNTEEVYNAFARHAKTQNLNQGRFYDQWLTKLRNGEDVVFGNGNTVNIKPDNMSEKKAGERGIWRMFWDDTFDTDRNHFSDAIATARTFSFTPKTEKEADPKKTPRWNKKYNFDYNGNGKDAYYNASHPGNLAVRDRFNYYLDWLENEEEWEKANSFMETLNDGEKVGLRAWYNHFQPGEGIDTEANPGWRREAALAALNEAMAVVEATKGGYDQVPEEYRDLLKYFNLGNNNPSTTTSTSGAGSSDENSTDDRFDDNGRPKAGARTRTGGYLIGKGKDGYYYTNFNVGKTPYLITRNDWNMLGLNGDYEFLRNAVIDSDGRFWTQDQLAQATDNPLYNLMERISSINNNTGLSGADRYAYLNQIEGINWVGKGGNYNQFDYTPDTYYSLNDSLRDLLGKYTNLSIFDASQSFGFADGTLLGYYDNSQKGTESWGFRAPYYLRKNPDGSFTSVTEQQLIEQGNPYVAAAVNKGFDGDGIFSPWQSIMNGNKNQYAWIADVEGKDTDGNGNKRQYQIYIGRDGKFYHKKNDNTLIELDPDLMEFIRKGGNPSNDQMDTGRLSGTSKRFEERAKNGFANINPSSTRLSFKEGGSIEKHQIGQNIGSPVVGVADVEVADSPLQQASNLRDSLTEADWKEISAAAIDLGGAIAGLIPGGSIVGAVSGLGSTGLYLSAAKDRKGKRDLWDWGQAGLATVLDAVSILPYIGEAAKATKISKGIAKVARPLSKVFNAIGLSQLVPLLGKNPKDWTSDDLIKLSTGISAALNIGHGAAKTNRERKLSNRINESSTTSNPTYGKERVKTDAGEKPIKLDETEIRQVIDSETPAEELRTILRGDKYKVVDAELNIDNKELLKNFGFETEFHASWKKDKRVRAKEQTVETPAQYNEGTLGWVASTAEQFNPFSNGGARRARIDESLSNPAVKQKIDALVSKVTKNEQVYSPKGATYETVRTTSTKNFDTKDPIGKAYAESLNRTGSPEVSRDKRGRLTIKPETSSTEVSVRSLDERYKHLGPSGLSNAEFAHWARNKGAKADQAVSLDEVISVLEGLPETKRQTVLNDLTTRNEKSQARKAGDIVRSRQNLTALTDKKSIYSDTKEVAKAFEELRKSKDPMATLRKLSNNNGFKEVVANNDQSFKFALEYAKANGDYSKMNATEKKKYDKLLEDLFNELELVLFKQGGTINFDKVNEFAKGGIIKAEPGIKVPYNPYFGNGSLIYGNRINFFENLWNEPLNYYTGSTSQTVSTEPTEPTGPVGIRVPTDFNPNWGMGSYFPEVKFETVDVKIPEVNVGTKTTTATTQTPQIKSVTTPASTATTPSAATTTDSTATTTVATTPQTTSTPAITTPQTTTTSQSGTPIRSSIRSGYAFQPKTIDQLIAQSWLDRLNATTRNTGLPNGLFDFRTPSQKLYDSIGIKGTSAFGELPSIFSASIPRAEDIIAGKKVEWPNTGKKEDGSYGGKSMDTSKFWTGLYKGALGLGQYLSQEIGSQKSLENAEETAWNTYYRQTTPNLQGISEATPIQDANVDYWTKKSQEVPKNASANDINNHIVWSQDQQQAEQGRTQAVREQSAEALSRQQYNQQIHNQQAQLEAAAENDSKQRISGINQIIGDARGKRILEHYTSIGNGIMEKRYNLENQVKTLNQIQYDREASRLSRDFDNNWKDYLRTNFPDAWATWNGMSASEKVGYNNDVSDWMQQSGYIDGDHKVELERREQELRNALKSAYTTYMLDPFIAGLNRQRYGTPTKKKGGKVGGNRYKNEPWEDIWINKNKAVHSAIAKLNDNMIKVFLKTLK